MFDGTLREGLTAIGDALGVTIEICQPLEGERINEEQAVGWELRGCTAERAIEFLLRRIYLDWVIEEDRIVVFATREVRRWMRTEVLPIERLADRRSPGQSRQELLHSLRECITSTIGITMWEHNGRKCALRQYEEGEGRLELSAPPWMRREVAALLDAIQFAAETKPPASMPFFRNRNSAALAALERHVTLDVREKPLRRVLLEIERQIGVPVNPDTHDWNDIELDPRTPVSFRCSRLRAADALARVLNDVELTWDCYDDVLIITYREWRGICGGPVVLEITGLTGGNGKSEDIDSVIECVKKTAPQIPWGIAGHHLPIPLRFDERTFLVASESREVIRPIAWVVEATRELRCKNVPVLRFWDDGAAGVRGALEKQVQWGFEDEPLEDALEVIASDLEVPISLDRKGLDAWAVAPDAPVSLPAGKYTARDALRRMLRPLYLDFVVRWDGLLITASENAEYTLEHGVFEIGDFFAPGETCEDARTFFDPFAVVVGRLTWEWEHERGTVHILESSTRKTLVVTQTQRVLDDLSEVFDALREVRRTKSKILILETDTEAAIRKSLTKQVAWAFDKTPLPTAIAKIAADLGVDVFVDLRTLEFEEVDVDETLLSLPKVHFSAAEALRRALDPHDMDAVIVDGALMITKKIEIEKNLRRVIYNVTDLVARPDLTVEDLVETFLDQVAPETWDEVGGPGALKPITFADGQTVLLVSQEDRVIEEVSRLLEELREKRGM